MSMILDALKRADRERRRQDVELPSLHSQHRPEPPPQSAQARRPWRRTALIALALLALGAAIGLALSSFRASDNASSQGRPNGSVGATERPDKLNTQPPAGTQQSGTIAHQARNERFTASVDSRGRNTSPTAIAQLYRSERPSTQAPPSEVSRLYQQPERTESPKPERQRTNPAASNEPTRVSLPEPHETATVRLSAQEQEPVGAEPVPASTPTSTPIPAPTPATATKPAAQPNETISIRELPWAMQQKIPSINYQAHHYREGSDSNNSTVTLNQKERRAGDEVSADIRVEQIEEDGVVLSYRGEKFKLRALNSWVNM